MLDVECMASDNEGGVEQREGAKLGGDGEIDGVGRLVNKIVGNSWFGR